MNPILLFSKTDTDVFNSVSVPSQRIRLFLAVYIIFLYGGLFFVGLVLSKLILPDVGYFRFIVAFFFSGISILVVRELMNLQRSLLNFFGGLVITFVLSLISAFSLQYQFFHTELIKYKEAAVRIQFPDKYMVIDSLRKSLSQDSLRHSSNIQIMKQELIMMQQLVDGKKYELNIDSIAYLKRNIYTLKDSINELNNLWNLKRSSSIIKGTIDKLVAETYSLADTAGILYYFTVIGSFRESDGLNASNIFLIETFTFLSLYLGSLLNYFGVGGDYQLQLAQRRKVLNAQLTRAADEFLRNLRENPTLNKGNITDEFNRLIEESRDKS